MRKIIYIFMFATVLLIVKAFYVDDYIAQYKRGDTNISSEVNQSEMNQSTSENNASSEENRIMSTEEKIEEQYNTKKKMPLDQLGDSIAEKIDDKL